MSHGTGVKINQDERWRDGHTDWHTYAKQRLETDPLHVFRDTMLVTRTSIYYASDALQSAPS